MSRLLSKIKAPNDVKKLAANELPELCDEIREEIISTVADNGGHLASNLGVVELTVALHRVFTLPEDCIVWDVGHQSYAHKLLTGREEAFSTLRREDGLSGFPSREESDCDPFTTGHSSASISSALGLSVAKALAGDPGHVIAVIGDGALTGGLAYEGLNNAGRINRNMIVILNDNAMSISRNVGSIARYLSYVRAKPGYLNAKDSVEAALCRVPKVGEHMAAEVRRVKNQIKKNIFNTTIFQDLGFNYYGPFDGHDLRTLTSVLTMARDMDKPVLIHIRTYKGRGYKYAENAPSVYHGLAAFDREKGAGEAIAKGFSHAFGETMCTIAGVNEKLCAVTAAMESGTGLTGFREKYRSRFFDVGIAEEHAVTFCAGLARGGMIPVFAVYSTFLQRAYDQLIHDGALQHLKIIQAVDRAGVVGEDGQTHQGVFDAAFLRTVPDIHVYAPTYYDELSDNLDDCIKGENHLYAIRYPRGKELYRPENYTLSGKPFYVFGTEDASVTLVTYGRMFSFACEAAEVLEKEGIKCRIVKLNRIVPIDPKAVEAVLKCPTVLFFEEGVRQGGIAEEFGAMLLDRNFRGHYEVHAIENGFIKHAPMFRTLHKLGLDVEGMVNAVHTALQIAEKKEGKAVSI